MPPAEEIDEDYWELIAQNRPSGAYYDHSHGDLLLYMKRVDKIQYDLVSAFKARKEKQLEEEL